MTDGPVLTKGAWIEGVFHYPIRVFYEDTDVGGMVYHARYVSFFERVRSESIRDTVLDINHLMGRSEEDGGPLIYVVRSINITYHSQARVGDVLMGHSMAAKVRSAAIEAKQWIIRGDELVAEAHVVAAIVNQNGRPQRWPKDGKAQWQTWHEEAVRAGHLVTD